MYLRKKPRRELERRPFEEVLRRIDGGEHTLHVEPERGLARAELIEMGGALFRCLVEELVEDGLGPCPVGLRQLRHLEASGKGTPGRSQTLEVISQMAE